MLWPEFWDVAMNKRQLLFPLIAASALISAPVIADVKAGVDAWAREDYPAAIREWEGPAARGDADAQFNLAQAHKWGKGVKQDLKRAEFYFGKAAAQGHLQASDNYGLLLFDRGERAMAMPYVKATASRGDPRAQYLLAIAHFNGDLVPKDWVRAYALMTLSRNTGLPQAGPGLQQMDGFIPLAQRQQAVGLAQQLAAEAEATRNRQLTASDLGVTMPPAGAIAPLVIAAAVPRTPPTPEEAVVMAENVANGASPRTAGADYARPATPVAIATPRPISLPSPKPPLVMPKPVAAPPVVKPVPAPVSKPGGSWRIQFGAFAVASNADAMWAKVRARPEVSGHPRVNAAAGAVIKLQAGGYSEEAARTACSRLTPTGIPCIPVRN